ncbi:hypothetical protein AB0B89_06175 [Sphaerisporangium sp. NPDC049002]|uniref:hypothetical protein n=1 Tax=unclassified Sphaerisporangium TaxID=2630420 RepID=UPI0033C55F05
MVTPSRVERQLAVLNQDNPAWRITRPLRPDGSSMGWWAFRRVPLTPSERCAGLVPSIARGDVVALAMELAAQDDIAHRARYSAGAP